MNEEAVRVIETELQLDLPTAIRTFLLKAGYLPQPVLDDGDVLNDPERIVALNRRLRRNGYYHFPWHDQYLAFGSDPGDCVYYFDLTSTDFPVLFANHDFDEVSEFKRLTDSPEALPSYFSELAQDWAAQDKQIR
jgi:hypothetical protein